MINHSVESKPGMYGISYQELRGLYGEFVAMSDRKFLDNLPRAIHFACITSFVKEVGPEASIGERGIVHELAHLLAIGKSYRRELPRIRKQFVETLKLA